jgi:hypothetical protein
MAVAKPEAPQAAEPVQSEQPVLASVRMPQAAPKPKEGEAPAEPTSIASLLGNVFSAKTAEPKPAAPVNANEPVKLRGSKTEMAKAKQAPAFRTASTPATQPKPTDAAAPKALAEAQPHVKQADKNEAPRVPEREMRTAYSAPPASSNGLLAGAQPVVPVGSFDSRWSGLR